MSPVAALINAGFSGETFAQCPGYIVVLSFSCRVVVPHGVVNSRARSTAQARVRATARFQLAHRLVGGEEDAAGQIARQIGRVQLVHHRSFHLRQMQLHVATYQLAVDAFEHFQAARVDEVDRAAHQQQMADLRVARDEPQQARLRPGSHWRSTGSRRSAPPSRAGAWRRRSAARCGSAPSRRPGRRSRCAGGSNGARTALPRRECRSADRVRRRTAARPTATTTCVMLS